MTEETFPIPTIEPIDAERAVLGALINDESAWDKVGALKTEDFTEASHRMIFEASRKLEGEGKPIDLVTVSDQLRRHEDYHDHPDILDYVRYIAEENFTSDRIEHYIRIVLNCSVQRHLRQACKSILTLINDPRGLSSEAILGEAERMILEVSDGEKRGRDDFVKLGAAIAESSDEIEQHYEWVRNNPGKQLLLGTPTGFSEFDNKTAGLQPGELVILAASPGMGKTSLAMNIAFNVAGGRIPGREGDVVAVFSMEMTARALADRMLAMIAEVDQTKLRTGRLEDANWKAIEGAIGLLATPNLFVYEATAPTPMLIRRMARRLRASHNNRLDLIVIDYLQLMPGEGTSREANRNTELSGITRELKAIAKELKTPVLCLSQLNRQGSGRDAGDAPKLQELRDSGAIEQDADIVMFLYKADENEPAGGEVTNAVLKVAKNRNGRLFSMDLVFTPKYCRFLPRSHDDYQGETPPEVRHAS